MSGISLVQTADRTINQLQQNISQVLNPVLQNPLVFGHTLTNQALIVGTNVLSHGLGRQLQGWFICRYQGAWAQVFDLQNINLNPSLTLTLSSSAPVTVDIYVF